MERFKWTNDYEMVLLDIWESKLADLRKQKRNSHIYAEMAAELKLKASDETNRLEGIEGNIVKTKINNLTQRYRSEIKTISLSGGKKSDWKFFDNVHKILGSLPCNDSPLVDVNFQIFDETTHLDGGSTSEDNKAEIKVECPQMEELFQSPNLSPACSSSTSSSVSENKPSRAVERKRLKRKFQDDIGWEMLKEFKRSNDLTEQELQQNKAMRAAQLKCVAALEATTTAILNYINKNSSTE